MEKLLFKKIKGVTQSKIFEIYLTGGLKMISTLKDSATYSKSMEKLSLNSIDENESLEYEENTKRKDSKTSAFGLM